MYRFCLLFVFIMLVSCSPVKTRVFILSGQSNMVGQGKNLQQELNHLPANVEYYRQSNKTNLRQMFSYTDSLSQTFGPEVTLIPQLAKKYPHDKLIFIKCARSGASLYNAFHPDGPDSVRAAVVHSGAEFDGWYNCLTATVDSLTADKNATFEAMFWMQGERDSRYAKAAKTYSTNLTFFIKSLRSHWKAADMLFICGRVNPPMNTCYAFQQQVRKAQMNLSKQAAHSFWIDCDDLSKYNDNLHYDSPGQHKLGNRFAYTYLQQIE